LTIPPDDNFPVNLHKYDSPNLIVEISSSTLNDDLGRKRLLYERVGISEYWVIDTEEKQAIAFSIADRRSGEIEQSLVLPCLNISLIAEVLKRSENHNDTLIYQWLLQIFS
jgi:Uma2 family endonuclease